MVVIDSVWVWPWAVTQASDEKVLAFMTAVRTLQATVSANRPHDQRG